MGSNHTLAFVLEYGSLECESISNLSGISANFKNVNALILTQATHHCIIKSCDLSADQDGGFIGLSLLGYAISLLFDVISYPLLLKIISALGYRYVAI